MSDLEHSTALCEECQAVTDAGKPTSCPACPKRSIEAMEELKPDERAELEMLRDVARRLLNFDGGAELLPWVAAHRHHAVTPYIGCPFCRDEFVPIKAVVAWLAEMNFPYDWQTIHAAPAWFLKPLAELYAERDGGDAEDWISTMRLEQRWEGDKHGPR